ncbi:hypothetical protein [Wenyingzhuangia sp. IMCC45574]
MKNNISSVLRKLFFELKGIMILAGLTLLILILSFILRIEFLLLFSAFLMSLTLFLIFILFFIEIYRRNWHAVLVCFLFGFFLFFISFVVSFSDPDFYAVRLEIPENIEFKKPLELKTKEEYEDLKKSSFSDLRFELINSFQPGIYEYMFWYTPKQDGSVYLKVFEITQNDPLSVPRLTDRSKMKVAKGESTLVNKDFTIYEGDWGQYYVARIEVWFAPENNREEYKLIEKNYIVEGWMR